MNADAILSDLQAMSNMRKIYAKDQAVVTAIITLEIILLNKYRETLTSSDPNKRLSDDETAWLKAHDKIKAIVLYRQRTGCSLTEAKAFIESEGVRLDIMSSPNVFAKQKVPASWDVMNRYERR